ncbi:MAG: sugar transporter substrate-binding protein, partial [Acidimicrobiaceae bacterium]|nr:sugar transporter substrate-binding protein [Acidimicrobiaceae bacterium]
MGGYVKNSRNTLTRRVSRLGAAVMTVAGVAAVSGVAAGAQAKPATKAHAVKAASSITVWSAVGPNYSWQAQLVKPFEKATGIHVNYQQFPETSMLTKVQAAQEVHSNAFAIFEEPESQSSGYLKLKGIAPIGKFLKDPTLTPASFDYAGLPSGESAQCTVNGVVYCLPEDTDPGPQMFYNKAMFAAAGLKAPTNWNQVQTDARKLTTSSHSGICMRGSETSPNGYPVLLMLPYFLPYSTKNKGEYLSPTWNPLFSTPQAATWA